MEGSSHEDTGRHKVLRWNLARMVYAPEWNVWRQHSFLEKTTSSSTYPQHWLTRFILEVRKKDGSNFPPETLHHLCSGIVRYPSTGMVVLCSRMLSSLNSEHPLTQKWSDFRPWELGRKRSSQSHLHRKRMKYCGSKDSWVTMHSPKTLLDTMVFVNGLDFAPGKNTGIWGSHHLRLNWRREKVNDVDHT